MTEDYGEGNLVEQAGSFMSETVLVDWNAVTVRALGTCDSTVLPAIEDLLISCSDASTRWQTRPALTRGSSGGRTR